MTKKSRKQLHSLTLFLASAIVLVGALFMFAGKSSAGVCFDCNEGDCLSDGYICACRGGCCNPAANSSCGNTPTPTPPAYNTPTPGESTGGGGGGGGSTPAPTVGSSTPTPTPDQCAVDCNHEVCGATSASCNSDADCAPSAPRCINGKCNKCTNPGTACCGYCVPQGWGCTASSCDSLKSCVRQDCLGWNGEGCSSVWKQSNINCNSACSGVACKGKDASGNVIDITCGAYVDGQCFEDCHDVPAPTLTPTPGPFSCSDLQVTNLYKQNNSYNMAQATVRNDSRYAVYITKTWFSWYDGVEPQGGAVDYFRLRTTNYWGGANGQTPNSWDNPTEVDTSASSTTKLDPNSSATWVVDIDGGLGNSLDYGRTDVCLTFYAPNTDRGNITCYNRCTGYDGAPVALSITPRAQIWVRPPRVGAAVGLP